MGGIIMNEENNVFHILNDSKYIGVAGWDFGVSTYMKNLDGKVDPTKPITIILPENLQILATSFIGGFFHKLIQEHYNGDVGKMLNNLTVVPSEFTEKIVNTLK